MSDAPDLAEVAHELAAPVAAIAALAELAVQTGGAVDWARFVQLVAAAAADIERIVLDADLSSPVREELDLEQLLAGVALQGGDRVRIEAVAGTTVRGDATRLRQALANLVRNGLRHGEHVVLSSRVTAGTVTIDVTDDGPGVDPGIDVFARGVSGAGSTGYGLWLARRIAVAHGGTLELAPGPGGARFRLVLPSSDGGS